MLKFDIFASGKDKYMEQNQCTPGRHCGKLAVVLTLIVAVTAITIIALVRDRIVNPPLYQVSITGQGKVSYTPDIAKVTVGVQIDKVAKPQDALSQLNGKINKIIEAVKAAGIPAEDIQTENYNLYPQYDYKDNIAILSGYSANQQLLIKIKNINNDPNAVSRIIAKASQAGANQVLGVSFDASNIEAVKEEARIKAISDAKSKAGRIAGAAGVRLGDIIGWWENTIQGPGVPIAYYGDKGGVGGGANATPAVPSGSQEVIIEMNLNYKIK